MAYRGYPVPARERPDNGFSNPFMQNGTNLLTLSLSDISTEIVERLRDLFNREDSQYQNESAIRQAVRSWYQG